MSRAGAWPPLVAGHWDDTHRLIPATYAEATPPYLRDLADSDADAEVLRELAASTNARVLAQRDRGTLAIDAAELVFGVDFAHVVNGAFCHPGQGARFSDARRGAWYCATEVDTSLAEVVHHRRVHLAETDHWHDVVEYQDYTCSVGGRPFAHLRGRRDRRTSSCLDPDSYVASQDLARRLVDDGAAGVVYPAVRRPGGTCIACFRPALLPPVGRGGRWRLTWDGSPDPLVEAA